MQFYLHLDVSENCGTPKSSFLIRSSIINHPFWGTPIFGNTHLLRHFFGGKHHRAFLPATPLRTSSNCSRGSIGTASNSSWPPFFRGVATPVKIATTPISPISKSPGSKHQPSESHYVIWLVVSAHFKNMLVKLDHFPR